MSQNMLDDGDWVPTSCTLPTVDQPLRRAEFDDMFTQDVLTVERGTAHETTFGLRPDPDVAARAAKLAAAETGCCSFFTFVLTITDGRVEMAVSVADPHTEVLEALSDHATELAESR